VCVWISSQQACFGSLFFKCTRKHVRARTHTHTHIHTGQALVSVDLGADNVETVWMQDADMTRYGSTAAGGVTEEDDEEGEGDGGGVQCAQQ
jgi:6-phosphogluconolactonase (cycloisomerase 2 family)